jgi:hypothetical protein
MDPISAGASVIAFIQVADRVVEVCSYIIRTVKDYPKDIRLILVETISLKSILEAVDLLRHDDPTYTISLLDRISGTIAECQKTVEDLSKLLPKVPQDTAKRQRPNHITASSSNTLLDPNSGFRRMAARLSFSKPKSEPQVQRSKSSSNTSTTTIVSSEDQYDLPSTKGALVLEALRWPMREPRARKLLQQLQHQKSTIALALSADSR